MAARPPEKDQFTPLTSTSKRDCVAAVIAYLIWRATGGQIAVTHAEVRARSGAPADRGLTMAEGQKAARSYGVELTSATIAGEVLWDAVKGGASAGVIVHCPPWVIFTGSTYVGNHEIYLHEAHDFPGGTICTCNRKSSQPHREYVVEDPGTKTASYLRRSESLILAAARKASGSLNVWAHIGPDTEGIYMTVVAKTNAKVKPNGGSTTTRTLLPGRRIYAGSTVNGTDGRVWVKAGKGDYILRARLEAA